MRNIRRADTEIDEESLLCHRASQQRPATVDCKGRRAVVELFGAATAGT
jgi:hypothetical protein